MMTKEEKRLMFKVLAVLLEAQLYHSPRISNELEDCHELCKEKVRELNNDSITKGI